MRIGIDLDGVVFDSEKEFRVYSELYDLLVYKRNSKVAEEELNFQDRFDWSEKEKEQFWNDNYEKIIGKSHLMPGAYDVINLLKRDAHELIVITNRGKEGQEYLAKMTQERLKKLKLDIFDKYCFGVTDKGEACKEEKIDIMIDDNIANCINVSNKEIKTIYFKDAPSKTIADNDYITTLYNWGEIYRYIKEAE